MPAPRLTRRGAVFRLTIGLVSVAGIAAEAKPAAPLPREVRTFVDRRDRCDHVRGEEPYDAARARYLARIMKQTCTGTDAQLARLKRRYCASPRICAILRRYETNVE